MSMIELGGVIITQATQRAELAAQNMANMTTAGYKAQRQFSGLLKENGLAATNSDVASAQSAIDFAPGKLQQTGNPFDLAISGSGFFTVRTDDGTFYTRSGQFHQDAAGNLVTANGAVLQSTSGDVKLGDGAVSVLNDGTLLQNGQPVAQLQISEFDDLSALKPAGGGLFGAPSGTAHDATVSQVHQGMLEASNVETANEMLSLMTAIRSAEAGQRVVQVYDDLLGRVLTAFGQM